MITGFNKTILALAVSLVCTSAYAGDYGGFDFNYDVEGASRPQIVFDDGSHVFFQVGKAHPDISCLDGGITPLHTEVVGPYIQVNKLCEGYLVSGDGLMSTVQYTGVHVRWKNPPQTPAAPVSTRLLKPATPQPLNQFVPLRHISDSGMAPPLPVSHFEFTHAMLLMALNAIIPSSMDAEIDKNINVVDTKITLRRTGKWTDVLEYLMLKTGMYARIDWTTRKVYIARSYRTTLEADTPATPFFKTKNPQVLSASIHVTPKTRKLIVMSRPSMPLSVSRKPVVHADHQLRVNHQPFSRVVQKAQQPIQPVVAVQARLPVLIHPVVKPKPPVISAKPEMIEMKDGDMLSDIIRKYVSSYGYSNVLWQASYDIRIVHDLNIQKPASMDSGLELFLKPAGLKATVYGDGKTIVINDIGSES
ncbi:MAG: hypothetical protein KGI54_04890 [Pseudomonadota bacterium]|nr:hypothetical protein [Pseudomonadota bacterium]